MTKVIVITGVSRGLGRAMTEGFIAPESRYYPYRDAGSLLWRRGGVLYSYPRLEEKSSSLLAAIDSG